LGFVTLMQQAIADTAAYSDLPFWYFAVAGWLTGSAAMQQYAIDQCMARVNANPTGSPLSGDDFQHIEEVMLQTALVADCCYARLTPAQLGAIAAYVNGAMAYWNQQNANYWPFDSSHNNYWNNGHLACALAGVCTEGFNASAANWRTQFVDMSTNNFAVSYKPTAWSGPQLTEGHYYSTYVGNSAWAMRQYDAVLGTTLLADSGYSARETLNMSMYLLRPHLEEFWQVGSEPTRSNCAPFHDTSWSFWYQNIFLASQTAEAQVAKAILGVPAVANNANNFWSRASKGFDNFYWNTTGVPVAALSSKTDRMLNLPTPGAAVGMIRSAGGFDPATKPRAAIIFYNRKFNDTYPWAAAYSHGHCDVPGFQWGNGSDYLVVDPNECGPSGLEGEDGSKAYGRLANIVTLTLAGDLSGAGAFPRLVFPPEAGTSPVPYYYYSIDAQPYWTAATIYRREYVWLDDLQVVLVFDRVAAAGDTKTWRVHLSGAPTISGGVAMLTSAGGTAMKIYDLYSSSGSALQAIDLKGMNFGFSPLDQDVWELSQADSADDFRSLKVFAINNRVTAASVSTASGLYAAHLTIAGSSRTVTFFDDGTHATIA